MKTLLLLLTFCPPLVFSQHSGELAKKYIPRNTVSISDSTFIGQTEITNLMYRQFVNAVRDSIFTALLYDSLPFERAKYFLDKVPENRLKNLNPENRSEYAKIYGLNTERYKFLCDGSDSLCTATVVSMYYPYSDRFFKRREVNVSKLKYRLPSGEVIPIYPDTLSWVQDYYVKYKSDSNNVSYSWTSGMSNMYFWHPVYDNFAIVGLNQSQMLAYCRWYEQQLNACSKNPQLHYSVTLPGIADYTAAMKNCVPSVIKDRIGPENLVNPIVYSREEKLAEYFVHKVYGDMIASTPMKSAEDFVVREWEKANVLSPIGPANNRILDLLSGVAEAVQNPLEPDYTTVLGGDYYLGIVDSNGIQANTLFYQRLLYKDHGYSFVGFRLLVTVTRTN